MDTIVNKIIERDRVFGNLCLEAEYSRINKNYFAALACLFVISEQIVKYMVNKNDGNFKQTTLEAKKSGFIDESEWEMLNSIRDMRNKIFHENHYSLGIEIKNKIFPISEDETKEIVYNKYSRGIFNLVLRAISN